MGDPGIPPVGPVKIGGPGTVNPGGVVGGIAGGISRNSPGNFSHKDMPKGFSDDHPTLDLNPFQLLSRVWFRWKCDRPVILLPNTSAIPTILAGQALAGSQFTIYYVPGRQPFSGLGSAGNAQASKGAGVVYLSHAGWWNLYYDAPANARLDLMAVDAADPAVASRYLFEAGIHGVSTNTSVTLTVADGLVLASNRQRKGFLLSLESVISNPARFGFNAASSATAGLRIGGAQLMTSFGMSGENCFQGEIRGIRDTTAVADAVVTVVEWF